MFVAGFYGATGVLVAALATLHVIQNVWRPILIGRIDKYGDPSRSAAILSVESRARSVATMVFAPLLGLAVDSVRSASLGGEFWPLGAGGTAVCLGVLVIMRTTRR